MRKVYLGLSAMLFLFLWNAPNASAQCPAVCDFDINMDFQNVNMTGNQTACFSADVSDVFFNFGGSDNTICVPAGVTWTQNFGGTFSNVTIEVYGTVIVPGEMTFNNTTVINVYNGGVFETSSTIAGPITVNNAGTWNYLPGANGQVGGQNNTVFNNLTGGVFDATALTNQFLFIGPVAVTNFGTMNFSSIENNEADVFDNYGEINISRYFFNHGNLYNYGDVNTACGMFGAGACEFIVGNKGPNKKFVNNSCVSINGNVTFNGATEINGPFQVVNGDLTVNFPVTGMDGGIFVTNGTSTITLAGSYVGTNLTICDEDTPGNDFDANNGNDPSMYTVDCTDAADPCGAVAPPMAGTCTCNEYIYLNEVANGGAVHKYQVNPDGSVTEINPTGPWYPNGGASELPSPHGLGGDLNGNLYIADDYRSSGVIRQLDCDGNLTPAVDYQILNGGTFNIFSIGNVIIANTSSREEVTAYSTCDGVEIGTACFVDPPCQNGSPACTEDDWGLYYDERTGYFYTAFPQDNNDNAGNPNLGAAIYRYTMDDFGTGTCIDPFVESTSTVFGQMPAVGAHEIPLTNISGITTDAAGNIYYVATGFLEPGQIVKLDPDGNFLAASAIDNMDGDGGFWGARAIVYSETSGKLYVSTQTGTVTEDCIAIFNTDLVYEGAAVFAGGTTGLSGTGKAMAIRTECCPDFTNLDFDQTACVAAPGDKINLAEYLPCEDICAGDWTPVSGTTSTGGSVGTFDDCDNSFTFQAAGEACFSYDYVPSGTNANELCGEFHINVCITFTAPPAATTATMAGTCDMANQPNDDAQVNLSGIMNADRVAIVAAGTALDYDQAGGAPYATADDLMGATSYDFTGLMHSTDYFVRVFNGSDGCYTDIMVAGIDPACSACSGSVTATPGMCDSATNEYTLTGQVTFTNAPATGTITVEVDGQTDVITLPAVSPVSYSIAGLTSDAAMHTVTVTISGGACQSSTTIASDDFESGTLSGGTGWSSDWVPTNVPGFALSPLPADGSILQNVNGSIALHLKQDWIVTRDINLTCATSTDICFDYQALSEDGGWSASDMIDLEYFDGASWISIWSIDASDVVNPADPFSNVCVPLPVTAESIRFISSTGSFADYVNIDNVEINCCDDAGCGNIVSSYTAPMSCSVTCVFPTATITPVAGDCVGGTVTDNATINLTMVMDGDEAGIVVGTDYDMAGGPAYGSPMNMTIVGSGTMFTSLMHNTDYVVRVFNMDNACYTDYPVTTPDLQLPVVAFTAPADLCVDAGVQVGLGGGTPMGGVYSGTGVTDDGNGMTYSFDPAAAGVGVQTLTYTYTDGNSCTVSATDNIEVFALPTVTFAAPADCCVNDGVQTGLSGGLPAGGVYSGPGITDDGNGMTYSFDPAAAGVGVHTLTYTYTDANGCTASATDDKEVFSLPVVAFTAPADLCVDAGVQVGLGGGTPVGGTYSGPGITDDGNGMTYSFDPAAAGVGVHTLTYTYTDGNGCIVSANDDVEVFALPVVAFTAPADLCVDAGVQVGLGGGTPVGGTYSGPGITDDGNGMTYSFDPAAAGVGVHTLTYTYTDGNGCMASASDNVEVFALPTVTFTAPADCCVNDGVQTGLSGGLPAGGVYSGPGITDDGNGMTYSFDPAAAGVGVHTLTYTYTDANGCTASATDDKEVFAAPVVTFTALPDPCVDEGITMGNSGGMPTGGVYSGPGVTDNGDGMTYTFDPAAAGIGTHTITYTYTDANGCSDSASDDVEVLDLPTVMINDPADECVVGSAIQFTGSPTPMAGTSGVFTSDATAGFTDDTDGTATLDPATAGPGTYTVTYIYTDASGCTASAMTTVEIYGLDFGDLDAPYPTAGMGAASHCVPASPIIKMGATVDIETDGVPSVDADGDGADEDGFDPMAYMFVRGQAQDVTVDVMNMTGGMAKLVLYIDWDDNGDFTGPNEMYDVMVPDMATTATLSGVTPPAGAVINQNLAVRFRLSTDAMAVMSPGGNAPDGEVEDYLIQVMAFDYGDLVDSGTGTAEQDYNTTSADMGPSHKIVTDDMGNPILKIGATIDDELDGQASDAADGDGADEDGFDPANVMFVTGQSVDLTIPVMNMTGGDAKLTLYIDWNNNGDFNDPGEMYFVTVADGDTEAVLAGIVPPLDATLNDDLGFRLRLTTDMAMSPTGPAPDGEVEDYEVMVMGFDYGDLADAGAGTGEHDYETEAANGGPSHKIITDENDMVLLKIGAAADDEADGQQSADADGDTADVDDEDGFDPTAYMFVTGQTQDVTIPVMNMTGEDAKLTIYIDWDNDGDFDLPEEMIFTTVADGATEATLSITPPTSITTLNDELGFRIRLTTDMAMSPTGPAPDGEVEDYLITVMGFDYGDLADAGAGTGEQDYETEAANGGPSHKIITDENDMVLLKIGAAADDEADGQQSADADGDVADVDDEDGFDPTAYMFVTGQTQDVTIPVMNMTGEDAKLTIYIDWDNDGDFDLPEEMIFTTVADGATEATLSITPPTSITTLNDELGFRIRLTTDMAMSPIGPAPDGEVEDYLITVMGFDYGDLADAGAGTGEQDYETDAANGGPSHKIITDENDMVLLKIGAAADDEADGQQSADADGDTADVDDEDGFDPTAYMFVTGQTQDVTIPVMNMTGEDAKLTIYVDWNNDGDFEDDDEMIFTTVADGDTEATLSITPPLGATLNDDLGFRIRLTTDMVMSPEGPAPDGEVEDYEIMVMGFDYGDLNDVATGTTGDPGAPMTPADHQTTLEDDGAGHKILTNEDDMVILKIGAANEDEADGQPSADAGVTGGDDNSEVDDEDGLDLDNIPFFILTQTTTLDIPVMNMTGEEATLVGYIDYNKDGFLDPATEKYVVSVPDGATSVSLEIGPIPADAVVGQDVGLRLRLANDMAEVMNSTGLANSGEVEDYMVQIIGFDFGDLPDSYVTTGPDTAPRHIISEDLKLGACVDVELDGIPEAMAGMMEGGDDADPGLVTFGTCTDGSDEDGIEFTHPFIPGNESCITVTAMNMTGEDAVLQVWIDWNGDGMFGAGEELAFIDNIIPDGGVDGAEYCFPVPADVAYSQGSLFIRARLSPDGGLAPDEQLLPVPFGEIEDYKVKLSKVGSLVWEDYNGNGEQDEDPSYGLDGVTVELLWYGPDGDVNTTDDNRTYTVQTATVDGVPGVYSFCGLNPGTYSLSVPELPTDFVPTWSDIPGDDVIDSDDHAGIEFTIEDPMGLLEGEDSTGDNPGGINGFPDMQDDLSFDFGAYIPAELGDYVWLDESFNDADDTQESTGMVPDVPIEGVTITLMGTNNIGQPVMLVLVTDENGFYKFEDLAPGSYKVIFDASTALGECGPILLAVAPNVGDDALDSDQDPGTFTTGFYDLFSGDDIPTVDAGFVEPPFDFGCIADLNVTLGDNCSATITPDMILTGLYYCIDEFIISIDGVETDQVTGCGDHTYMIRLIEDGVEVYTCWGNIFAEDKTDPVVDCPDDVSEVTVEFALQTLEGSIDGTEEEITLGDYSCFQSFFEPAPDFVYNYDLITFTVDPDLPATDIYNIQTASNIPGLFITLFQGEFNEENPCENVLGGTEGAYFIDPFGVNAFFAQDYRIELALEPGQTYTLLVANTSFGTTGDYVVGIVSDNGGTFSAPFSAPAPVDVTLPLYCEDLALVNVLEPESYLVNANGVIDQASISAELAAILDLTGYPEVGDDCGPVLVTVSDEVESAGDCGDITITRTFVVSDRADGACVGTPRTAECTQVITLTLPTIADLIIPPYTATIECDEEFPTDGATGGPDDNPHASVTGYPFLLTASGYVDLNETYCNLGANYSDEPRIDVCEGTYKFRREWNLIDWCNPSDNTTWDQFVKVGDFTGPVISGVAEVINVSTSPFSCVANVAIPTPTVVDGNDCGSVIATTYTILAGGESFFAGGNILDGDVVDVPVGEHTLILCAEDNCGNETCEEYTLIIQDEIEPSAVCDDELNVSIGGGDIANGIEGIARIFAEDVDEGSYDNCGDVTLEVRRNYWRNGTCDASENRWSPWGEFVDFYCCDIANEITIELRVTDESGNQNICWMTVTPEDKLNPYCYAPQDVELDCNELPLTFPGDIEQAYEDDFAATSLMMDALFGAATGTDNCAVDTIVERTPNIQINECGWGSITRRFEVWQLRPEGDVNGNGAIDINEVFRSTNSCSQDIIINEVHDFTIDFPEDAAADCGEADVPTVITSTDGCDVLSVNIGDPVVFSATGDECYKYSITYDVINWCLWDGEYTGYVIPRMTEDDGESLPIDRAVEGNERPVVTYDDVNGLCIDRRHNDRDGDSSLPNCESPTSIPNYGRYIYTQFVKIYDSTAPVVTVGEYGGPTANCPDLLPGQFGDDDGDCEEGVSIPFSVSDECELFDNDGNLVVSIVSAELDAFAVDANEDGDIKSNEFVADLDVADLITDNGDGTYSFDGTFPIITSAMGDNIYHAVRILFEDGCGNQVSEYIVFDVIDCKGPAPICINGLTVTLMPQDDGSCAMAIWASDFEGSPISDCTGQGPEIFLGNPRVTKYAIYRAETVEADPNFVPSPDDTGLVLTQDDEETTVLYIYAFDEEGNYDYCETYVLVQAHVSCGEGTGTIAGVIMTEEAEAVEGVEVNLNGMMDNMMVTNTDGTYSFAGLPLGGDYSVTPYLNANPLNGVTTFDLIKISQHVLNVAPLDSPYKMIAADANRSGTITTLDMIQIRKLILNIITEFPSNTSWRFVDAAHAFTDMSNPWADEFPELINVNNLAADILDADFVGVKIGDVNGSAQANALAGEDRNLEGIFNLQIEDVALKTGNTYTVAVSAAQLNSLRGFQGTMSLSGVALLDIEHNVTSDENFGPHPGLPHEGRSYVTMSWNGEAASEDVLFSLVIQATEDQMLSEALGINSRYTMAEAYRNGQTTDLGVEFTQGWAAGPVFELYQNTPNPFEEVTMISFNLPQANEATITIRDAAGRLIKQINGDYAAGYNTVQLTKRDLQGASGVMSYTVEAGDYKATRQMVVVQ